FESMPNFRARRELVARLGETYLDPSILPQFRALLRRLKKLGSKRNALAHCAMHANISGNHLIFRDAFTNAMNGGLEFTTEPITNKEILDLAMALDQLASDLSGFHGLCAGKVHASARKHREQQNHPNP